MDYHVAKQIPIADGVPLYIGIDFGLTPAAVFGQGVRGRWLILNEIVAIDMGIVRFAEMLRQDISTRFSNLEVKIIGDPAGLILEHKQMKQRHFKYCVVQVLEHILLQVVQ